MPCAMNTRNMPRIFRAAETGSEELVSSLKMDLAVRREGGKYAAPTRMREKKMTNREVHSDLFRGFFSQY